MSPASKSITSAIDLFPDLFQQQRPLHLVARREAPGRREHLRETPDDRSSRRKSTVAVPQPPDTSWLASGSLQQELPEGEELRHGLLLISDEGRRDKVATVLADFGYLLHLPGTPADAIAQIQRIMPAVVIADASDAFPDFHPYLAGLAMTTRRLIYYTLIGPEFRTLYNLEALANSVNLVVSYQELDHLNKILRLGFQDYQRLFQPYVELLRQKSLLLS